MNWWAWVVGGSIMLGSELSFVNAQFYLVFIGVAAMLTGLLSWVRPDLPDGWTWLAFALLSAGSMLAFRSRLYARLHQHSPGVHSGAPGGELTLPDALSPGESCRTEHGGSYWTVCNDSHAVLAAGSRVRVAAVQGLTLMVRPAREGR
jgi:membrane protein implicated in regulation of membrane protease activity